MGRRDRRPEDHGRERGEAAWPEIVSRYDEYSLYEFLKSRGFSEGAIEFYAVMNFVESDLHNSFGGAARGARRRVRRHADHCRWHGRAAQRFHGEPQDVVRFGTEVRAIQQDPSGVTLRCRIGPDTVSFTGDYAICTVPFSVLRPIEHRFSHEKERAIRQLNYHASTKILLRVRDRFWEQEDGIVGGGASVTDLPIDA